MGSGLLLRSRLPHAVVTMGLALAAAAPAQAAPVSADRDRDGVFEDLEDRVRAAAPSKDLRVVVVLAADATRRRAATLEDRVASLAVSRRYDAVDAVAAEVDAGDVRELAAAPGVVHVEPVRKVRTFNETAQKWFGVEEAQLDLAAAGTPVDGDADGAPTSYSTGDLVAAVIDSGIDETHPDLDDGKVLTFRDFTPLGGGSVGGPGIDPNGHGTHVSGTIAGNDDEPGNDTDGDGVVPGAGLVGLRVLDENGEGSSLDVLDAIDWIRDNGAAWGIEAVNLSLGSEGCSDGLDAESQALNELVALGYVVTVAAGNAGPGHCTIGIPAAASDVITVGAMADIDPRTRGAYGYYLADFSSRGPTTNPVDPIKPDVVAPGVSVTSARANHDLLGASDYVTFSGTSMAAPFVAGVALLMRDANTTLTPAQVKQTISQTARDFGRTGDDSDYGAGRLDAYAAVASSLATSPGALTSPPTYLPPFERFESTLTSAAKIRTVTIGNTSAAFPVAVGLTAVDDNANLDMYVYDANGGLVGSATLTSRQDAVFVRSGANGPFEIDIVSRAGAGAFILDVSGGDATEGAQRDAAGTFDAGVVTPAPTNTSPPTVDGTAAVGHTLTGQPGTWTGATTFTYEWQRCSAQGTDCVSTGDADTSYTVSEPDAGRGLRLAETASNSGGTATAYSRIVTVPPTNTAPPSIQGEPREGATLSVAAGTWVDAGTVTLSYVWERCDAALTCTAIPSASGAGYTATADDVGSRLRVIETAMGAGGSASVTSVASAAVLAALRPPVNAEPPSLTGRARHGAVLQLSPGAWSGPEPTGFAYEWLRCGAAPAVRCETIEGATEDRYRVRPSDVGSRIVGRVSASNADGSARADTPPTNAVDSARPARLRRPGITGGPRDGGVLRAAGGTWWGTPDIEFGVTWLRCSRKGTNCRAIAFRAVYVATRADVGHRLRTRVVARNDAGRTTARSNASAIVRSLPSPRPKARNRRRMSVRIASDPGGLPQRTTVRALDL